jgi:nickel-dependent lactate racemase
MVSIPWKSWHGDEAFELHFPEAWDIAQFPMNDAPPMGAEDIRKAILSPIEAEALRVTAGGKETAVIVVDDISRPTPASDILPIIIEELEAAGLKRANLRIIMSLGAHRPMIREELIKKLGKTAWDTVEIHNHHPYENLSFLGNSAMGTPIHINTLYMEADVKVTIGCILPHVYAGFGGGAKLIVPGIAGMETLQANHQPAADGNWGLGVVEGNPVRRDMEDIVRRAGLDFSINAVVNSKRQIAGLFAGDAVAAHRAGVHMSRHVYETTVSGDLDVGIFNAYPKDTELFQASLALNPYLSMKREIIRKDGVLVITTASPEGGGFHSLEGCRMRMHNYHDQFPSVREAMGDRRLCIFSPNVTPQEVGKYYSSNVLFFEEWSKLTDYLQGRFPDGCRAGIFPCASIQLFSDHPEEET